MSRTRRTTHLKPSDERQELLAQNGIFLLDGEINESTAYLFVQNSLSAALAGFFKDRKLLVILNSPGGNVEHGFAIHDCIAALVEYGIHVDVLGLGLVASMGTVILQAGSRRLATKHTQFLVHQISQTIGFFQSEEVSQLQDRTTELTRLNDIVMGIIATRSGIELEELKKRCNKTNYWLAPEDALKLGDHGLIDEVSTEPLGKILRAVKA